MERWPAEIDEILGGDLVVVLAYATPAAGTVLLPVNNYAVARDSAAGTLTAINSSVGGWRKLERMRQNPRVALSFHSRTHGTSRRPEYVLVQGVASLSEPIADYPAKIGASWERFEPWRNAPALWRAWQRAYATRVEIEIAVERVVVWPDLACAGQARAYGTPFPVDPPDPQRPPANGTGPRLDHRRVADRSAELPHRLAGWIGADGFPVVVPVGVLGADGLGILLRLPAASAPPGARRAGLTAHSFSRGAIGQVQRKHTGWLEVDPADGGIARYAPHTRRDYRLPASMFVYRLALGGVTRWEARRRNQPALPSNV
jgi:nitroimidazol reductase NimA-like FMN-containing flavoprotein (pyridoxamine 5'-phosphate oxidase superfamily)